MTEIKLMNMCMIYDKESNKVVVQDKINTKWNGITFPGGHVENAEGIIESTIREVKEETGLNVRCLRFAGLIDWYNNMSHERWFVFLFKTHNFSGELINETHEGKVSWVDLEELHTMELADGMKDYLKLFQDESLNEAYAVWNAQFMGDFEFL